MVIHIGIMHPYIPRHMLPEIIDSDIHKLRRVKGAPAVLRRFGGVGTYPVKGVVFDVLRLPDIIADPVPVKGMPCDRNA